MCDSWGQYCNQETILLNILFPCIWEISCIFLLLCMPCNFLLDAKEKCILSCWVLVCCCLKFSWALFRDTVRLYENSLILCSLLWSFFWLDQCSLSRGTTFHLCIPPSDSLLGICPGLACASPSAYASAPDSDFPQLSLVSGALSAALLSGALPGAPGGCRPGELPAPPPIPGTPIASARPFLWGCSSSLGTPGSRLWQPSPPLYPPFSSSS